MLLEEKVENLRVTVDETTKDIKEDDNKEKKSSLV